MIKRFLYLFFLIAAIGCSSISKEEITDSLTNHSYWLIYANNDTLELEFMEGCARNFDWGANIIEDWEVTDTGGTVQLRFDGSVFEPKPMENGLVQFLDSKHGARLIPANGEDKFDASLLIGEWNDARYANLDSTESAVPARPPCPNNDPATFLIPGIIFKPDSCIVRDFCGDSTRYYSLNKRFGTIAFDTECTGVNQWKIKKLTNNTLTVDVRFQENNETRFEYNKLYLKANR